ncbi:nucleotide exchange factor GrpE [Fodinisporobacter ferrooxydans]|uniref:Nucleotide exchange factor GrpE n=1 Tax=Fodinisporobacter ferrooxydans TaxID=2901836 RepID=A0ABY4CU65_9BACL|nr:nucleotide exchange factor GrpE [Alicyclobacillaceae bacterium MYW30-H2]
MLNWLIGRITSSVKETLHPLSEQIIEQISEQNQSLEEQGRLLEEQLSKLTRLQYKTGNDILGKLQNLNESIGTVIQWQEVQDTAEKERNIQTETKLKETAEALIRWLDDLDLVRSRTESEEQAAWNRLFEQWSEQILHVLDKLDIHEMQVLGNSFDPRFAESIGTVPKTDARAHLILAESGQADVPYQVIEVVKRGFVWKDGSLLRKAQVITLEKEKFDDNL